MLGPTRPVRADAVHREALRPLRSPVSPRHLTRRVRPAAPRTGGWLELARVWGRSARGVEEGMWQVAAEGEVALGPVGLAVGVPLEQHLMRTEGIFGPGDASVWSGGDLRLGLDLCPLRRSPSDVPLVVGLGGQVTIPTEGDLTVRPHTPEVGAPAHTFFAPGPTVDLSAALAVGPWRGLSTQVSADLLLRWVDLPARSLDVSPWVFAGLALDLGWQPLSWLALVAQLDTQMELRDRGPRTALRQLVWLGGGVRVKPWGRWWLEASGRGGLGDETRDISRFSCGVSVGYGGGA